MTDGVTLQGLYNLAASPVSVRIGGLDCGDYIVDSDGKVFVPFGADSGGLFTAAYLMGITDIAGGTIYGAQTCAVGITNTISSDVFTVYVPVVVGYDYKSQGQLLRPVLEGETKSRTGSGFGKTMHMARAGFMFVNTWGVSIGTNLSTGPKGNLMPCPLEDEAGNAFPQNQLFTGVVYQTIDDTYSFDCQLAWQVNRGHPCVVTATTSYIHTDE